MKGTIVGFERINPHSVIVLDQPTADGRIRRRAVDGPAVAGPAALGVDEDSLKPGDTIEVCGLLVLADGQKRFWSDYGQLRQCISDEERAALPCRWPESGPP